MYIRFMTFSLIFLKTQFIVDLFNLDFWFSSKYLNIKNLTETFFSELYVKSLSSIACMKRWTINRRELILFLVSPINIWKPPNF